MSIMMYQQRRTLQQLLFPSSSARREEILTFINVKRVNESVPQRFYSRSRPSQATYMLCITVSTSPSSNASNRPSLYTYKVKDSKNNVSGSKINKIGNFSLKKEKNLKSLSKIIVYDDRNDEFGPKVFTLVFGQKTFHYEAPSVEEQLQFCWWLVEVCRYCFDHVPTTTLDKVAMDTVSMNLVTSLFSSDMSSKRMDSLKNRIGSAGLRILAAKYQEQNIRADENKDAHQLVIIPPIMAEEEADIIHFLEQSDLHISEIDALETYLMHKRNELQDVNIRDLLDTYDQKKVEPILARFDEEVASLFEAINAWMANEDTMQLDEMRENVNMIEEKNANLQIEEVNHKKLADCLEQLLTSVQLPPLMETRLREANLANRMAETIEAAHYLERACNVTLDGGLEHLKAVKEIREQNENLKQIFCDQAQKLLVSAFSDICKSPEARRASASKLFVHFEFNEPLHRRLLEHRELIQVVSKLDPKRIALLRTKYTQLFGKVLEPQIRSVFANVRELIDIEDKNTRLRDFPPYPLHASVGLTTRRGNTRRSGIPPIAPANVNSSSLTTSKSSTTAHALAMQGKRFVHMGFVDTLNEIIPVVLKEQAFCLDFFATANVRADRTETAKMLETLFSALCGELKGLADLGNKIDHFYSLNMLVDTENAIEANNDSEYLVKLLTDVQQRLGLLFQVFIDEEIKWITDLNVSPKRCGVLEPVAKFPSFVERIESVVKGQSQSADSTYRKMVTVLFNWVDSVAKKNSKYSNIVWMENYHYFCHVFSNRPSGTIGALDDAVKKANAGYQNSLHEYVKWNVSYELPNVVGFWDKLERKVHSIPKDEVVFQPGLSKHDLRCLTKEKGSPLTVNVLHKKVNLIYRRIQKHLPTNPEMVSIAWKALTSYFIERFSTFEELVSECYRNETLTVTTVDITSMFEQYTQFGDDMERRASTFHLFMPKDSSPSVSENDESSNLRSKTVDV